MEKFICIHGHFYQPPRENPWLEEIELQDSAFPYHDWNARINEECYSPNAASRILGDKEEIINILNNYSRISFNFGPTLLSWLEEKDPETYQAIIDADKESVTRFNGHGSAIAQAYNHMILPLSNPRDKETQILWGIRDFEIRFGRYPEGMWLPETAVDTDTLEILARLNISFVILSPRQAKSVRKIGDNDWEDVSDGSVNPRRAYKYSLPSGKSVGIFYYDGGVAHDVAFNNLLRSGKDFAERLLNGFGSEQEPQLVHIATDGESYGHHHRHGDMALAYAIDYIEHGKKANLINYGEFLEKFPPVYETQIIEDSSWSCVHGVERWRSDCGCNTGGNSGWNQKWRGPLREALDKLNHRLDKIYEEQAKDFIKDPWVARNEFIDVILDRSDKNVDKFLKKHSKVELNSENRMKLLRLLEMQRHAMLMYTSCGWFFDEISGIEGTQVLLYACRAIQMASQLGGGQMEDDFMELLAKAPGNMDKFPDGAEVYRKIVLPSRLNLKRVAMHFAVSSIFEEEPESLEIFNYTSNTQKFERKEAGAQKLASGVIHIKSITTHSERSYSFCVLYLGQHHIIGNLSDDLSPASFDSMQNEIHEAFDEGRIADLIGLMQYYFGYDKYTLWHLFKDEKRKVLNQIMGENLKHVEDSFRSIYNRDYQLLKALDSDEVPIPNAYRTTIEYVLNADLLRFFNNGILSLHTIENLHHEFRRWGAKLDAKLSIEHFAGEWIYKMMKDINYNKGDVDIIKKLNAVFDLLPGFKLEPNLEKSQNLYFSMLKNKDVKGHSFDIIPEWIEAFDELGNHLKVKHSLN